MSRRPVGGGPVRSRRFLDEFRVGGLTVSAHQVERLLEELHLGEGLVEGELGLGEVLATLGLGDREPVFEEVELLDELVVAHAKIGKYRARALELVSERGVVVAQGRHLLHERARSRLFHALRGLRRRHAADIDMRAIPVKGSCASS